MNFFSYMWQAIQAVITRIVNSSTAHQLSSTRAGAPSHNRIQQVIQSHQNQFLFWAAISVTVISIVLVISITQKLEGWLDPTLLKIKRFAPFIMQATLGIALVTSAYYGFMFEPSLSLPSLFGEYTSTIKVVMSAGGVMLLFGFFPRVASLAALLLSIPILLQNTNQALLHAPFLGETITVFIFGGAYHSIHGAESKFTGLTKEIRLHLHKYKFFLLRIFLGGSLIISAASYRLFSVSEISQVVVSNPLLIRMFPDPGLFVVTALALQVLLGIFFLIGFEIRFASLAYLGLITFLITYFQYSAWPYIILIGTPLAMLTHGYDKFTVGGRWLSRGNLEPIL